MPEASDATKHCIKYPHKVKVANRQVKEQIERLLERTDHSELSAAAPLVVNAILDVEHERAVSCQEMARHLMNGSFDGGLATFSREVTTLVMGGRCGVSGARKHVDVMFDGDGNAILSSKSTSAALYWSRFDYPCEMGAAGGIDFDIVVASLSMFAFTAAFEFDLDDATFKLLPKYNGVRVVPDMKPDLDSEDWCQQACYLYIPHGQGCNTEAERDAQLLDGCESWREAWMSFAVPLQELESFFPFYLPDVDEDLCPPREHSLKPPPAVRAIRWGLLGAPQVPLGQLLVPKDARPKNPWRTMLRMGNVAEMRLKDSHGVRLRDPKLGGLAGANEFEGSDIEYTDLSDIETHVAPGRRQQHTNNVNYHDSSDDGLDEETVVGGGTPPDDLAAALDGIPRPPPGFKFSGHGGYFTSNEDIADAARCLSDIVKGSANVEVLPANLRLFQAPDRRDKLDSGQRRVLDTVTMLLDDDVQVEVFVTGGAGCGKTFTVMQLCQQLQARWNLSDVEASRSIRVAAAFGLAARNASGTTLGGMFGLVTQFGKNGQKKMRPLSPLKQQELEIEFHNLKVLILEEIGTIGAFTLTELDKRLQLLRGNRERWGGVHVVFMGDPDQLLPVKDTAPWYPSDRRATGDQGPLELGAAAYHAVVNDGHVIKLEVNQRQTGAEEEAFRGLLERMKAGNNTPDDFKLLEGRTAAGLGQSEYDKIAHDRRCVHLFPRNKEVNAHNLKEMQMHGDLAKHPILAVGSLNSSARIRKLDTQNGGGIPNVMLLRVSSPMMLRRNLHVLGGLVNGSMGVLADVGIVDGPFARPDGLPDVVLMAFKRSECTIPSYNGWQYKDETGKVPLDEFGEELFTLVPITPMVNREFDAPGLQLRPNHGEHRTGLPLVVAHAMTIHKCQGLTLGFVCAHMDSKAKMGMDYVLFSRCTSFTRTVVDSVNLSLKRLQQIRFKNTPAVRKKWKVKKLMQLKQDHQAHLLERSQANDTLLDVARLSRGRRISRVMDELERLNRIFTVEHGSPPRSLYGLNAYPVRLEPDGQGDYLGLGVAGGAAVTNLTIVSYAADVISELPPDDQSLAAERAYRLFVRDVLTSAGLQAIERVVTRAARAVMVDPCDVQVVTAIEVAAEMSQSTRLGYAFLSLEPGFPHDDLWRGMVDGRALSATKRGAVEALQVLTAGYHNGSDDGHCLIGADEQLDIYRAALGVNVDAQAEDGTGLPALVVKSHSTSASDDEREDEYALSNSKEGMRLQAHLEARATTTPPSLIKEAPLLSAGSDAEELGDLDPLPLEAATAVALIWAPNSDIDVVTQLKDNTIDMRRSDFLTLQGLNWLNDNVINGYLSLLEARSLANPALPTVWAASTFFYPKLKDEGFKMVKSWTSERVCPGGIFSYDVVIVPIHLGSHWACGILDTRSKTIEMYDSLGISGTGFFKLMKEYIVDEAKDKNVEGVNVNDWVEIWGADCPKQTNSSDCGMFSLKFADYRSRDLAFAFSQRAMPNFRRRTAWELYIGSCLCTLGVQAASPGTCLACGCPGDAGVMCQDCGGPIEPDDHSCHYNDGSWWSGPRQADCISVAKPARQNDGVSRADSVASEADVLTVTEQQEYFGYGDDIWDSDSDVDEEAAPSDAADPERQLYKCTEQEIELKKQAAIERRRPAVVHPVTADHVAEAPAAADPERQPYKYTEQELTGHHQDQGVLNPVTIEVVDELKSKEQHVGETLSGPGSQVLEQLTETEILHYHFRELGSDVLDPDDPDNVRDVLVAAGLLVIQLLLAKATKWIADNTNGIFIVTADCIAGELTRSSQFGYASNWPDPGFPYNDRSRAEVDGSLLSAIEGGAAEAVREVAKDTQLDTYRHSVLGVNIDVLVDACTCLPVLQLTSSSELEGDVQDQHDPDSDPEHPGGPPGKRRRTH